MQSCCIVLSQDCYELITASSFACRQGWSAQQLFDQLKLEEFAQTGGLLPMDPRIQAAKETPAPLTAELFARLVTV